MLVTLPSFVLCFGDQGWVSLAYATRLTVFGKALNLPARSPKIQRTFPGTKIPSVLHILKKEKGLIRQVSERSGKKGAVYVKI